MILTEEITSPQHSSFFRPFDAISPQKPVVLQIKTSTALQLGIIYILRCTKNKLVMLISDFGYGENKIDIILYFVGHELYCTSD